MRISDWSSDCALPIWILGNVRLHSANDLTGYIGAIVYNAADENVSDNRYLMMLNSDGNTDTYMTLPVVSRYVVPTAGTYRVELMYQATVDLEPFEDRKSVVSGKSVTVSFNLGGRRIIKKKKKK